MAENVLLPHHISKRKNSAILIFCIFSVQLSTSVIIYYLHLVTNLHLLWITVYYVFTFFCAIPQSGFSDVFGRKKHLLISCYFVCLSAGYLLLLHLTNGHRNLYSILVLPVCLFLGVAGNSIPIARAGIADLKIHDFRTAMGWSTIFIGFGWGTAVILGFILSPLNVIISALLIQLTTIFLISKYFQDAEDYSIHKHRKKQYFRVIFKSYKWFGSMFMVTGGAAAIFAYLFAETSFYQIYSLDEEGTIALSTQVIGLLMAVGYAFGVIIQWIIYFSDKKGIKYGIGISSITLIIFLAFKVLVDYPSHIFLKENADLIEGILDFLFSFGFGFTIPSLFSLMSKKLETHHFGKLFGAIDSTDTCALSLSFFVLYLKTSLNIEKLSIYLVSLLFFLVSVIFYLIFIKRFSSYEIERRHE